MEKRASHPSPPSYTTETSQTSVSEWVSVSISGGAREMRRISLAKKKALLLQNEMTVVQYVTFIPLKGIERHRENGVV